MLYVYFALDANLIRGAQSSAVRWRTFFDQYTKRHVYNDTVFNLCAYRWSDIRIVNVDSVPNGTDLTGPPCPYTREYKYDAPVGRLTKTVDWAGEHRYRYDARGREVTETHTISNVPYSVGHSYDSMDRETRITYPDGEQIDYWFNQPGLNSDVVNSTGQFYLLTVSDFNAAGQPKRENLASRTVDIGYRTSDLRLESVAVSGNLHNVTYGYDRGQLGSVTDNLISGASVNKTATYTYDHRDRLRTVSGPYGATYQYDNLGNMTLKSEGPVSGAGEYTTGQCGNATDDDGDHLINDGCTTDYSTLRYGPQTCGSGRPHAVKTVTGKNPSLAANPNLTSPNFTAAHAYDPSGNLLA